MLHQALKEYEVRQNPPPPIKYPLWVNLGLFLAIVSCIPGLILYRRSHFDTFGTSAQNSFYAILRETVGPVSLYYLLGFILLTFLTFPIRSKPILQISIISSLGYIFFVHILWLIYSILSASI
jgi:hypothetical protein